MNEITDPHIHSRLGLWLSMIKTYRSIQKQLATRLVESFGLSLAQFQFLSQLASFPEGRRMSDIAEALMMSNGNVTGLSRRLRKIGWVDIDKEDDDRRVSYVKLSEKGHLEFDQMLAQYELWVNEIFSSLPEDGAQQLRNALREIRP